MWNREPNEETDSLEEIEVPAADTEGQNRALFMSALSGDGDSPTIILSDESKSVQMDSSLKLLFGLSGATMQLPSLALLAIVNDRVAIPPAYLPAYGAIAFLPYSLKPMYAYLSSDNKRLTSANNQHDDRKQKKHNFLLALLMALSGVSYMGTARIPVQGVVSCFVWGFLRGITSAWSEFLMNQSLIFQAQQQAQQQHSKLSYQAISSLFQSQALTYSNLGSLVASFGPFFAFLWRHQHNLHHDDRNPGHQEEPLSDIFVSALLLGTGLLSFSGSALVVLRMLRLGTWSVLRQSYDALPTVEEQVYRPSERASVHDTCGVAENGTRTVPLQIQNDVLSGSYTCDDERDLPSPQRRQWTLQESSDVASLVLLQTILLGAALRRPIMSVFKSQAAFIIPMTALGTAFAVAVVVSSCFSEDTNRPRHASTDRENNEAPHLSGKIKPSVIPPRRLGLYLILRHCVPISSALMYYYVYTVFEREPLFLQTLRIVESAVSVGANWVYSRFIATRFFEGWGMIGLIGTLSIVASLVSLLDVIVVHRASALFRDGSGDDENAGYNVTASLRWLAIIVGIATYFMGQIGYMPSVVLATANVVGSSGETNGQRELTSLTETQRESAGSDLTQGKTKPMYDEGVQYSIFVSCIDFGAQLNDWISVPIISALGTSRENNWANLDRFIVICAMIRIASVAFLWLIRPQEFSNDFQA